MLEVESPFIFCKKKYTTNWKEQLYSEIVISYLLYILLGIAMKSATLCVQNSYYDFWHLRPFWLECVCLSRDFNTAACFKHLNCKSADVLLKFSYTRSINPEFHTHIPSARFLWCVHFGVCVNLMSSKKTCKHIKDMANEWNA